MKARHLFLFSVSAVALVGVAEVSGYDSNSEASPVVVRQLIQQGRYVPKEIVEIHEFLNYYTFPYESPEDDLVSVEAQLGKTDNPDVYTLLVSLRAQDRPLDRLASANITFLLDASGSMAGRSFELAKMLIVGFVRKMKTDDVLSLVTFNRKDKVWLEGHRRSGNTEDLLLNEIFPAIQMVDITDVGTGIRRAYKINQDSYDEASLNQVILISDGAANFEMSILDEISKYAADAEKPGIYLSGIGIGNGLDGTMMKALTDRGRGAYLFIDSPQEIERVSTDFNYVKSFDLALKNVGLQMSLPDGWEIIERYDTAARGPEDPPIPQYVAHNGRMLHYYRVRTAGDTESAMSGSFAIEASYTPLGGSRQERQVAHTARDMLSASDRLRKADAVVAFAQMLRRIQYPFDRYRSENLAEINAVERSIQRVNDGLRDGDLNGILSQLEQYRTTIAVGERFPGSRDAESTDPSVVLGIDPDTIGKVTVRGDAPQKAIAALSRLGDSVRLVPQEGYRFLVMSTGEIRRYQPVQGAELSRGTYGDPLPEFISYRETKPTNQPVYDLHQIELELVAPPGTRSFSFDFNFFSGEYPQYVNKNFNDTFYAILRCPSTNNGGSTGIAFDSNNNSIEVDNNFFEQPFHPIPNTGTGFDQHGSTGWLRTTWPVFENESFTLVFSLHDEGDRIYDSLVAIDNFQWHTYDADAISKTDPLN